MKNQDQLRAFIVLATKGDVASEEILRNVLAEVAIKAPRHNLVKIMRFIADVIWQDVEMEAIEKNKHE